MATTYFTCPHCGIRTSTDLDCEAVDLGNGLPDALFPRLAPGIERHCDMRLCCPKCYDRAASKVPGEPHPYDVQTHIDRMARFQAAVDAANPKTY